jgi:uncharacterized protein (TIGR00299 family) protein
MKILYFDLFAGCSGDMILAALADLGADIAAVGRQLAGLPLSGYRLECGPALQRGIRATRFRVVLAGEAEGGEHAKGHRHDPHLDHGHAHPHKHRPPHSHGTGHDDDYEHDDDYDYEHDYEHEHEPSGHPSPVTGHPSPVTGHSHRTFADIRQMLEGSTLPAPVVARSVGIFEQLARVEGRIHGQPPVDVAFHEVGAVDSVVDIVGIALALDAMGYDGFACSAVNVGAGTLTCAHGVLPVPAPATAELLQGFPVYSAHFAAELVTPTGAAVLRALVKEPGRLPAGTLRRTGYGAGSRSFPNGPNVLRLMEIETTPPAEAAADVTVLECQLDDMNPELVAAAAQRLLADGALDVVLAPVQMKKFRPGTLLSVLCRPADRERLAERLLAETTTFGLRWHDCRREELERRHLPLSTRFGVVQVKAGLRQGRLLKVRPEFEECRRLAEAAGVGVDEVYREVEAAIAAAWSSLAQQIKN